MGKKVIQVLIILTFGLIATAKAGDGSPFPWPSNNIHLNLLGDAAIFSIDYERMHFFDRKYMIAAKVGFGYSQSLGLPSKSAALLAIPMHFTGNISVYKKRQYIEFGIGYTLMYYEDFKYWDYALYPIVGYRFQPYQKVKITFRIFISYPLTDKLDMHNYWFSPVGLSLGYCF
jgi:hypothetical protein